MKLRRELIDRMARRVGAVLVGERLARERTAAEVSACVAAGITADLQVEDRLNDEVRELLRQHAREMDQANVEYHEMFKKLKAKLVRDRKLIL